MTTLKKHPRDLAKATGSGSAVINFKDIRGEVDSNAAYLYLLTTPLNYDNYIRFVIHRKELNQGEITLPSDEVQTEIKLGASTWSANAGAVKCDYNDDTGHITGTFKLIDVKANIELSPGFFDATLSIKK